MPSPPRACAGVWSVTAVVTAVALRALLLRAVAGFSALLFVSALGVTAQLRVAAGVWCAWWSRRTVAAENGRAELSRCWLSPRCS